MQQIPKLHPTLSVVQVMRQFFSHGGFLKERTVHNWLSGEIFYLRVITNQVEKAPIANISDPYNPKILELVKDLFCLSNSNLIFVAYYKVAASHQDLANHLGQ